jgi:thiamine biosynthesis lipoprotein
MVTGTLLALALSPPLRAGEVIERQLVTMGTALRVQVEAADRLSALRASEAAVLAVEAVDRRLATRGDGSELDALLAAPSGEWTRVGPALAADLALAHACREATDGGYDLTLGSPGALELRGDLARLAEGATLDAGGIGKGVALDAGISAARAAGASRVMLDLGGQVASSGAPLQVALAHPWERQRDVTTVTVDEGSVATSGQGVQPGHIRDPRTGQPAPPWGSVSVIAASAAWADCLATGLFALGPEGAATRAETLEHARVILQLAGPRGEIVMRDIGGGG